MNIITFDIEEWALAKARGVSDAAVYAEYDRYLDTILKALDERGFPGTFFCTGKMATEFPQVVRRIVSRGHEIGCHSNIHTWLNKMTEQECREDTHAAVDALEQCIGKKVLSYRAPAFSIGEKNKWAFEILAENGIERDASVFPAVRDFGGFAQFGQQTPCTIEYNGIHIKEFPIPMATVLGKQIAYSGGGYFRLFPLTFVKKQIAKANAKANGYVMTYFHIGDLLPESKGVMSREAYEAYFKELGTVKARYTRYVKANLGKKGALMKLEKLIASEPFMNIEQACECIDWERATDVSL